jgi:MFS family permease
VAIPVKEVGRYIAANRSVYVPMFLGIALNGMVNAGSQAWTPALFSRNYGWNASQFGSTAGTISLILSPIGLLAGIKVNEWLYRRGYHDANMRLTAIVTWLLVPGHILMPMMPTAKLALACFAWTALVGTAAIGSQAAALTLVTPNQMRGQVTALYMFIFNVIGYGLGPVLVALCTDYVFGHESELRFAMVTIASIVAPAGAIALTLGVRPYGRTYLRTKHWQ